MSDTGGYGMQALRETDPRRIGPYAVLGRLGAGGMGAVYLAESPTGLQLAVRLVRADLAEDHIFRARFRQEVRAALTVGGPGTYTARVVDADTESERPWVATEFVDGPSLRDALLDHGPLPEHAVRVLAAALGEALTAIHAKGLVHRDLNPSNILLTADGPRVTDCGIVRALEATSSTRTRGVVGSAGYVSPEQIRTGGHVGPPSDVFSLGAVLVYAAAGHELFGEGQDAVVLMRVLSRDFDLSGVPEGIRALVEPCLREEPEERPTPARMIAAAGHTAESLAENGRPGWYTATAAPAKTGASAETATSAKAKTAPESEPPATIAIPEPPAHPPAPLAPPAPPTIAPPAPVVPPAPPVLPSRRRLLQGLAAGTLVAAGAGGWLWVRDRDGGDPGARGGASGDASPSAEPAAVAWQYEPGGLGGQNGGHCAAFSPDGAIVYVGGDDGTLHALTPAGEVRWKTNLGEPVMPPLATADGAYCLLADPIATALCAVDPHGVVRWTREFASTDYMNTYGWCRFPVASGDLVLVTTGMQDGTVRAYRPDGSVAWENERLPGGPTSEPMVADGVVYVGTQADVVAALDATDGSLLWTAEAPRAPGRPALVGRTLVVGSRGDTAAGEPNVNGISLTGEPLWHVVNPEVGTYLNVLMATYVTFAALGDLAVTTNQGPLVAVDPADGSTVWTFQDTAALEGSGDVRYYNDPTVFGDHAYVCFGRKLYMVGRNGKPKRVLRYADTSDPHPVLHRPVVRTQRTHGDRAYVPTAGGIASLDLST
ncbi:PQQ-binding-like beta-propeller repeat protein [Streptomyces sp. NPDC020766]|uniref:protein kinase domain-containing protein n=1 Tax=Streptomyces sp. NPDC020766 TaxID=3155011 RepID=UPI0033DC9041